MQEMLNTKKFGDIAFRDKDFKSAIDYYSKVCASCPFTKFFIIKHWVAVDFLKMIFVVLPIVRIPLLGHSSVNRVYLIIFCLNLI